MAKRFLSGYWLEGCVALLYSIYCISSLFIPNYISTEEWERSYYFIDFISLPLWLFFMIRFLIIWYKKLNRRLISFLIFCDIMIHTASYIIYLIIVLPSTSLHVDLVNGDQVMIGHLIKAYSILRIFSVATTFVTSLFFIFYNSIMKTLVRIWGLLDLVYSILSYFISDDWKYLSIFISAGYILFAVFFWSFKKEFDKANLEDSNKEGMEKILDQI